MQLEQGFLPLHCSSVSTIIIMTQEPLRTFLFLSRHPTQDEPVVALPLAAAVLASSISLFYLFLPVLSAYNLVLFVWTRRPIIIITKTGIRELDNWSCDSHVNILNIKITRENHLRNHKMNR